MQLRITTFNTLFGAHSMQGFGAPERWTEQMEFLRKLGSDVIALQECNGWDVLGRQRLHLAVRDAGMAAGVLAEANHTTAGHRFHTAILASSRVLLAGEGANREKYHHTLGWADFFIPGLARKLEVRNVHLDPFDPHGRITEVEPLKIHGDPSRLSIILGDFNSVPPTAPEADWETLPRHSRLHHREIADPSRHARTAAELLISSGLVDTAALTGQEGLPTGGFEAGDVTRRQDLILVSPPLVPLVTQYNVHMEPVHLGLSDHAAITITLDLNALASDS
ncbi:endonuclease/exonuclease/phosphatase family protein [Streptomyces sp. NPDC056831]|uniref:endonuclease/exonuclease/phosphatase family protein n=1 Tax=Streptomyces sp. NPDC056831 TaxID=3345954 RepID=UPI00369A7DAC